MATDVPPNCATRINLLERQGDVHETRLHDLGRRIDDEVTSTEKRFDAMLEEIRWLRRAVIGLALSISLAGLSVGVAALDKF